ncbi:UrcA family protein [Altererythrobacter sp. Z27]|uniref:UrcA family protein n=1 Tax=Altererythrobacter sp. Z27 TaxID=3461147 RepID=UPI0040441B20
MSHFKFLIPALSLAVLAAPAMAKGSEQVEFTYKTGELATPEAREALLDRIKLVSARSCQSSSPLISTGAQRYCAEELENEIVRAIGDVELMALSDVAADRKYRAASR